MWQTVTRQCSTTPQALIIRQTVFRHYMLTQPGTIIQRMVFGRCFQILLVIIILLPAVMRCTLIQTVSATQQMAFLLFGSTHMAATILPLELILYFIIQLVIAM